MIPCARWLPLRPPGSWMDPSMHAFAPSPTLQRVLERTSQPIAPLPMALPPARGRAGGATWAAHAALEHRANRLSRDLGVWVPGRDFCFVDRQVRVTVGGEHHYLDLLFFHRGLRCLVALDLKIGAFDHRDAGQMHFYLNWIAENLTKPDENPPVGLLLCAGKDEEKVHYATANLPRAVFVSRYMTVLPSEEQLTRWLHDERLRLARARPSHS